MLTLDELLELRNALLEAHCHISGKGKLIVNSELVLATIEDALQTVAKVILEAKHGR
jgi:hypothetical protein